MILKDFLHRTGKKAVSVMMLQMLFLSMLAAVFLGVVFSTVVVAIIECFLAIIFLFVLFFIARKAFGKEFPAVAVFFFFLLVILAASIAAQFLPLDAMALRFQLLAAIAFAAVLFFVAFRIFLSRDYSHGVVISSEKNSAIVQTEYDFLAGINPGNYGVEAHKHFPKGEKVKLKIGQGLFGRSPKEIIE